MSDKAEQTASYTRREQPENPSRANRQSRETIPVSESTEGEFSVYISRAWTRDHPWPLVLDAIAERLVSAAQRAPSCSDRATTSLPRVTADETTSTRRDDEYNGSPLTTAGNGQPNNGPTCRDTHTTNSTTQEECAHGHSGRTTLGDVVRSSTINSGLNPNKVQPATSTSGLTANRQSLNPPTAQQIHRDPPPDEHSVAKRVAGVGLRYQSTSPNSPVPPTNNSVNQPQEVTVNNSSHTAAVTPNTNNSSPPQGLRPQPECIPPDAQLVPPEEAMSVPVHPLEKLTTALDNVKVTIHNMMSKINQTLIKVYKIYKHKTVAQQQVLNYAHWHNVKLYLPDVDPETLHNIIQTVSAPLLNCIREHYTNTMVTHHNSIVTIINNTYLTIHNENNAHLTEQMITWRIRESTWKRITHLKDMNNNNNTNNNNDTNTNNNTTTQSQDTNTTTNNTSHTIILTPTVNIPQPIQHKHSNRANRPSLKNRSKQIKSKHTPEQCLNPNCLFCAELNIVNLSDIVLTDTQKLPNNC